MPELPEVEHARRSVEAWCLGRRIERAEVPPSRLLGGADAGAVARALGGAMVAAAERRGKHLLVVLDGDRALHVHLGMSGRLERHGSLAEARGRPHVRLALGLDDGAGVCLRDARMFGKLELGASSALRARIFGALGPDPVLDALDGDVLVERLGTTRRPIKVALMDQAVVAGLGNIYVAEALWRAGIHPDTPASTLGRARAGRLAAAIHEALGVGLRALGEDEARHGHVRYLSDGEGAESPFAVYDRAGERCSRCRRGVIAKETQAGRSTYYCPRCQRPARSALPARREL